MVSDGWAGKPSPFLHQLLLLPALASLVSLLAILLRPHRQTIGQLALQTIPGWAWSVLGIFEVASAGMFRMESTHFHRFGYAISGRSWGLFGLVTASLCLAAAKSTWRRTWAMVGLYTAGLILAIHCFPLNYLRSDMLPVIGWADSRLLAHQNPYGTMFVGGRVYDFPYLPGMLVGFLPARALRLDLRWASLGYVAGLAACIWGAAKPSARGVVAVLLGFFLLCPFLQYRHDLYLGPHWLTMVAAVVMMRRRQPGWAGFCWGVSCGIYQLSWVIFPFAVLYEFRQASWRGALRTCLGALGGALLIVGPFLRSAVHQVGHNTVGQWRLLPHALADPINLSYWVTFLVRPDQLMWVQAAGLVVLFAWCVLSHRCSDLQDTLRWMIWALAGFIALNVLVDGYFYLTLLLLALLYVCVANDWWAPRAADGSAPNLPRTVPADA